MKKFMDKIKKNNKGFTLVELIVVVAVLAIITVVVAPQYLQYVDKARVGTDENALGEIAHVAEICFVEMQGSVDDAVEKTNEHYVATLTVSISEGEISNFASTDSKLNEYVDDIVPVSDNQYEFKSDTYKEGTATIAIIDGVATVTDGKAFTWNAGE